MKKNIMTRLAAAACSVILAAGMLAGCGNSKSTGLTTDGDKTLFSYNGVDVPLKEAWIYARMSAAQYEQTYSSYFGENFWTMSMGQDEDGNPTTFEDYAKEQTITQIKQIIVLDSKAEELGLSLDDTDKENCAKYAEAFAKDETGKGILKECGAGQEDMQKIYEDNALASKVQEDMIKDTDTNVSDDEARETSIARVVFATTTTGEDGQTTDMSEDEKAKVLKTAKAAYEKLAGGTAIEDIAEEQEYTNTTETFAAGESEEGEAFEKKLAGMKDGDIVDGVQECDNGYVIAQLTAYTDQDATEQHRQSIIAQRQQELFQETYDKWTEDLEKDWDYKTAVDQELWAQVVLHSEESTATESAAETTEAAQEGTTAGAEETSTAAASDETATTADQEADTAAQ
ncbi:MAG: peptidyl-prolyl cis-trans isomerase [Eubacterium sp.]|nr:peptidyl-prolyl cis-trans isomerase [Eubacterium sp.]